MQLLQSFFTINYDYPTLQARQRARAVQGLIMFAVGMLAVTGLYSLFNWFSMDAFERGFSTSILVLGLVAFLSRLLLNSGELYFAAWVQISAYGMLAIIQIYTVGVNTAAMMILVVPVVLSGILLGRREVILTTFATVVTLSILIFVQFYVLDTLETWGIHFFWNNLILVTMGALMWMVAGEFSAAFSEVFRSDKSLSASIAISEQFSSETDEAVLYRNFAFQLQEVFGLQQVLVYSRDENTPGVIHLRAGAGATAQRMMVRGRTVSLSDDANPLQNAYRQKTSITIWRSGLAHMLGELLPGSNSQLVVPLLSGTDEVLGVVDCQSVEEIGFGERDANIIGALARQFTNIIINQQLQGSVSNLQAEQADLFQHIEQYAVETRQLRRQAAGTIWDRFFRERGSDVIGFDIAAGANAVVPNDTLSTTVESTLQAGTVEVNRVEGGYVLGLPIVLRGQVFGAMEFEIQQEGELPTRVVDLATVIAERLSLALDNARLVEQTQAAAQREQQLSTITGRLQGAGSMEDLLTLAAEEFNEALGGTYTNIRLQLAEGSGNSPAQHGNGGGA